MCSGVSIIICGYNSVSRIPITLEYIASQNVNKKIDWEVIIVDNNSSDETVEVALKEWEKYDDSVELRIIQEKQTGLSHARQCGVRNAKFDFLIFCDDDNWLSPKYVETAFNLLQSNPKVGVIGGNGEAHTEELSVKLEGVVGLAINPQGDASGDITNNKGHVYGAGAIFRKSGFEKLDALGFSSMLTDRKGEELSSGNDTELCYAFRLIGYKIYYDSSLKFKHCIPEERLTKNYLKKLNKGFRASFIVLETYSNVLSFGFRTWWNAWSRIILIKFILVFKKRNLTDLKDGIWTLTYLFFNPREYRNCYSSIIETFHDYIQDPVRIR